MLTADTIAMHSNTRATTPWTIWSSQVLELARVSCEDMEQYFTRERLSRAYSMGEAVWMAADAVAFLVTNGKREDRNEREANYLAGKMRVTSV